jgi:hypothetical protein
MNEINKLEEQLRSWTPRRPSPKLERHWLSVARSNDAKLGSESRAPNRNPAFRWTDWPGLSWSLVARVGVPALACLLMTAAILMQPGQGLVIPNDDQPAMIALAMSNQNFAPYLPGSFQPTANRLDTFGWTNGGDSPSSMQPLTPSKAIDLQ